MTNQTDPLDNSTQKVVKTMSNMEHSISEVNSTLDMLRTEVDRAGFFGFGRRIMVPPDEIHVVVGDSRHTLTTSKKRRVYGQSANQSSYYWLNSLTRVIKLKTISFTVPLRGPADEGIEALDSSRVSFKLWAHAVAKLNPEKAEIASQRVGLDTTSLINTITKVGTAELVSAAATMSLEEVISNRQELAHKASQRVNQILSELGYDLALLTITELDGVAYQKLVEQAGARISKETSIVTNKEQIAEIEDRKNREHRQSEIDAQTEKKLASERLEAEEEVQTATLSQQENLNIRRHELKLKEIERQKSVAQVGYETDVAKVELAQKLAQTEVTNKAELAQMEAERQADLRGMQQKREAGLRLVATETEAERLAVEQARQIERDAERTQAEAKRLRSEELAAAERAKEVALLEANQIAEGMKVEAATEANNLRIKAEAEANALRIQAETESNAELIRADAEANATEKRARAAKIRAQATRAETAAPGLAQTEVEAARVEVAEKQVVVTRAEGLAEAEVAQAKATAEAEREKQLKEIEIEAQRRLADLYTQTPVLVELEKIRMNLAHEERLVAIQTEAQLKAIEAIAPSMNVNIIGNGGQTSRILTEVMSFSKGLQYVGKEIPTIGQLLDGSNSNGNNFQPLFSNISRFTPYLQQVLADVNPRMFSSLKVSDLIDRLGPAIAGEEDLVSTLNHLREDANFRVVGDLPVKPLLSLFGLNLSNNDTDDASVLIGEDEKDGIGSESVATIEHPKE